RAARRIRSLPWACAAPLRYHRQQSALRGRARARGAAARVPSRAAARARGGPRWARVGAHHHRRGGRSPRSGGDSGRRGGQYGASRAPSLSEPPFHLARVRALRRWGLSAHGGAAAGRAAATAAVIFRESVASIMSGNTIGKLFTVTTFGESHGPAMGCIVDGCPPGLALAESDLQADVDRRRTGTSHFVSQRRESDQVRILSGVFEGRTTGTPIGILIENTDARPRDYER